MRDWVALAQKGEREAFERLVLRYKNMAIAVAYDRLRDPHLAEDAVQEAFTEAFLHLSKLEEPNAFPAWLKRIVLHQCSRLTRRKRHMSVPFDSCEHFAEAGLTPDELAEQREMRELLHRHIDALSPAMRVPVLLFYYHGYTLSEISSCLDTPVSVLKKRLYDARRKLKVSLPVADLISAFHQLHEGGKRMLHIVNGDTVAVKLKQGVVPGEVLVWREIYSEGPVAPDPSDPAARSARADYLSAMGIPRREYIDGCESQERQLRRFRDYDEVVLWFEHDLFDQTMLCCLLNWFSEQKLGGTKLQLLCIGSFPGIELFRGLGQLSAEQMESLSGTWHTVEREELERGKAYWEAFASSDPRRLEALVREEDGVLPFARDAFRFHLSRFPSTRNGLGIVEQTTLETISRGRNEPIGLFGQVGDRLHRFGMGDLQFWTILKRMAAGPQPLIGFEGGEPVFPRYGAPSPSFRHSRIFITDMGRRVLTGEADWLAVRDIDDWLGGVHLRGNERIWRWDDREQRMVLA